MISQFLVCVERSALDISFRIPRCERLTGWTVLVLTSKTLEWRGGEALRRSEAKSRSVPKGDERISDGAHAASAFHVRRAAIDRPDGGGAQRRSGP